jgi:hypothetical protein
MPPHFCSYSLISLGLGFQEGFPGSSVPSLCREYVPYTPITISQLQLQSPRCISDRFRARSSSSTSPEANVGPSKFDIAALEVQAHSSAQGKSTQRDQPKRQPVAYS